MGLPPTCPYMSLGHTAPRTMRRIAVKHFAERPHAGAAQVFSQRLKKLAGLLPLVAHRQERIYERTKQPRPDGSLVIGAIPLPDIPLISAHVAGISGVEAAKTYGGEQTFLDHLHHLAPAGQGEQC